MVKIKRIYEQPEKSDGYRVLVDRLWPRGVNKEKAALSEWLKGVAPSNNLRKWFDHKPERFDEFRERYIRELRDNPEFSTLKDIVKSHKAVTLLYAAHDEEHNEAILLQEFLGKPNK
jgi:uncharacterized protein YeaO (DUF488 family)